jgi:2'-5' RNA ligase
LKEAGSQYSDKRKATVKAALALLADYPTQNFARRMVFELCQQAEIEFFGSLLPAHVSLKQPFVFERMDRLEAWFDALAARILPFEVSLEAVYYDSWPGYAILGLKVVETPLLRALHNQINRELAGVVADPSAAHDGDEYRFHLTVELGPTAQGDPYRDFYDRLAEKTIKHSFRAQHLAMFIYADRPITSGSFILYRVMPLGQEQAHEMRADLDQFKSGVFHVK